MIHYKYEFGSYYLMSGEDILWSGPVISIAFTYNSPGGVRDSLSGMSTLHKHGSPERVKKWYDNTIFKFEMAAKNTDLHEDLTNSGFPTDSETYLKMARDLIIITGKFPVALINRCIDCTGYIGQAYEMLKKIGEIYESNNSEGSEEILQGLRTTDPHIWG